MTARDFLERFEKIGRRAMMFVLPDSCWTSEQKYAILYFFYEYEDDKIYIDFDWLGKSAPVLIDSDKCTVELKESRERYTFRGPDIEFDFIICNKFTIKI